MPIKAKVSVAVICLNASTEEDVFLANFETTAESIVDGDHLDSAVKMAQSKGYEGPFFAVDDSALPALIERLQSVMKEIKG